MGEVITQCGICSRPYEIDRDSDRQSSGMACCLAGTMAPRRRGRRRNPRRPAPTSSSVRRSCDRRPRSQQKLFLLPPGYKIEPVLADPLIEDPVGVTFDGNGRMYVLEMRSYMQDADGSELARADQPHLAPRGHRRRRRLRQAHGVRRQAW